MNVRQACENDFGRIAEILVFTKRSTYRPIFQNDNVSFNVITVLNVIDEIKETGIENTYLYDDGIVKGMTRFKKDENGFEICELYIDPFFQNEGVGSELIKFNEEKAKELNVHEIHLWVLEKNPHAIKFYEGKKFAKTGERKEFATTGQYLIKYSKQI